jgi:hypothetical protein
VDRGAARAGADAGLAENRHRGTLSQRRFERAQLAVDVAEGVQLVEDERVVSLAEAVQVEDEPAEIAIRELAGLAQEAHAPSYAPSRGEAGSRG